MFFLVRKFQLNMFILFTVSFVMLSIHIETRPVHFVGANVVTLNLTSNAQ